MNSTNTIESDQYVLFLQSWPRAVALSSDYRDVTSPLCHHYDRVRPLYKAVISCRRLRHHCCCTSCLPTSSTSRNPLQGLMCPWSTVDLRGFNYYLHHYRVRWPCGRYLVAPTIFRDLLLLVLRPCTLKRACGTGYMCVPVTALIDSVGHADTASNIQSKQNGLTAKPISMAEGGLERENCGV